MNYIIQAQNIRKSFASHVALDDVSLVLEKGKITGLLGPNGAGKTSLIRILNGIIKADSGSLNLAPMLNEDTSADTRSSKIGYLPEERGLYKKMKVEQQLLYLAQLKGLSKSQAKDKINFWLEKFDIASWRNKSIEELSKGMAQKIQFIATVIHEPELLILDEPFSGFDPLNTELIKNEILELKNKGVSILLSTHNMNSVEELCDEILLINRGEVVLQGRVDQIKRQFSAPRFEILFSGNMISFTTALWTGFELVEHQTLEDKRIKTVVEASSGNNINSLLEAILPSCKISHVKEVVPSMHEIFLAHVQENTELKKEDTLNKEQKEKLSSSTND